MDHGGAYVLMPRQFLRRSNIISILEEVHCKNMPKCMASYWFVDSRKKQGVSYRGCFSYLPASQSSESNILSMHRSFILLNNSLHICPLFLIF